MEVIVLGVGDLSHPSLTNTSFLLKWQSTALIDCGYNVFEKLLLKYPHEIKHIHEVYITHLHSDHVGSLGQLIYYRFFKYNLSTTIFAPENIFEKVKLFLELTVSNISDVDSTAFRQFNKKCYNLQVTYSSFKTDHFGNESGGFYINKIVFTGDTDILNPESFIFDETTKAIFHDCTIHPIPKGVHASITDIQTTYPKDIKDRLILVHHGFSEKPTIYEDLNFALEDEKFKF